MPEELLGPLGVTVGALIIVTVLWRLVIAYINDLRNSRDHWHKVAEVALSRSSIILATLERIEKRLDRDGRQTR